MRRLIMCLGLLLVVGLITGCQSRLGCRSCNGILSNVVGKARTPMTHGGCSTGECGAKLGGCESGACGSGGACANGACAGHGMPRLPGGAAMHHAPEPPAGPPVGSYAYPYYTLRGPRDFLQNNPPSIGP